MASPGAVSAVTSSSHGSGATRALTEERKRKRKESNRLSAQRSRARKQQQVDELEAQVAALRARNGAMAAAANEAARRYAAIEAENELLRARTLELTARWESLAELIQYMDAAAASFNPFAGVNGAVLPQPPLLDTAMYGNFYY
ncbi:bZIP transcription factor 44-like [Lolium rigidum]|uniref:bZIP transcription factor 44-like n=1 Tax=Lolium rigidum TaxID=89674 RepID=UPI001F5CE8A6|nr:bZIP transcription factor 44-like [Lolium rigidum]